ncbi:MAG: hypothetical protein Q9163_005635 [Psora crenata]
MSLVSTHKSSESGLVINLHPLVLLTISDYITRHVLRKNINPIVGALLGQQSGRSVSLEHAFECLLIRDDEGGFRLHETWFKDRLQQYKDVHQAPALELVGWFTTVPPTGPEAIHVPLHQQILANYNETAVLLAFHPAAVFQGKAAGGKLPLTVYESVYESGGDASEAMDTGEKEAGLELRFRELPYSIETGEAEMIGIDSVARGGGNATAVDGAIKADRNSQAVVGEVDGTRAVTMKDANSLDDSEFLSGDDEKLIASMVARANAVKMLHARIRLLKSYLTSLPPSYLTTPPDTSDPAPATPSDTATFSPTDIDYPLLRSIRALLARLPLLLPSGDLSAFEQEMLTEKLDVELVTLLGSLGESVKDARELGIKFAMMEAGKNSGPKMDTKSELGVGRAIDFGFDNGGSSSDLMRSEFLS